MVVNAAGRYGQMLANDTNMLAVAQIDEKMGIISEYMVSTRIRGDADGAGVLVLHRRHR